MSLRERIQKILSSLNTGLIEREEAMNLTFLSAIAGESIFFLGPPGVAKSLIARRLKYAFKDAKSFEYLMHRFSTPDEVFGPISIKKLKNEDKLERVVEFYLPGANVAFLDEIWKAGPSIQNTLLTILNEKVFRNGEQQIDVDLFGIIAASNELPEENQGLDALWDRFLVRYLIKGIENRENFEKMMCDVQDLYKDSLIEKIKISKEEYHQWQNERDKIEVPIEILNLIHHIRTKIEQYNKEQSDKDPKAKNLYISDRRWKKIINILRTSAFLNDRKKIDLMDCFLIPYMIWDIPGQIDSVKNIVKECIRHQGYTIILNTDVIQKEIEKLTNEIETETKPIKITKVNVPKVYNKEFYKILNNKTSCYIKIKDLKALKKERYGSSIELYNSNFSDSSYYTIRKVDNLTINYDGRNYKIEEETKEKREVLTKKPHELLINDWDKRIENLKSEIRKDLNKIEEYVKKDLKNLKENLFVDPNKSEIILNKIEELKIQLRQLELRCNELTTKYHNIEEGKVIEDSKQKDQNYQIDEDLLKKFQLIMEGGANNVEKDQVFTILEMYKQIFAKKTYENKESFKNTEGSIQIIITDDDLKFWIKLSEGNFTYGEGSVDNIKTISTGIHTIQAKALGRGEGTTENSPLTIKCSMDIFASVLFGEIDARSAIEEGEILIDGIKKIEDSPKKGLNLLFMINKVFAEKVEGDYEEGNRENGDWDDDY